MRLTTNILRAVDLAQFAVVGSFDFRLLRQNLGLRSSRQRAANKFCRCRLLLAASLAFLLSCVKLEGANLLLNGEFTGSLNPWVSSGTVFNTGDTAVFSDSVAAPTSVFQSVIVPANFVGFQLTLDVLDGLASSVMPGNVPDVFFATLYLGVNPFGPSLSGGVFDQAIALFDMDYTGGFNLAPGASFGPSPKGPGWTRYSLTQATAPAFTDPGYMTLAFEFFNLNGIGSDSVVAVDNVLLISAIPEPGRIHLLVFTFAFCFLRRRR